MPRRQHASVLLVAAALLAVPGLQLGCQRAAAPSNTTPRIDDVELVGADAVDADRLLQGLATRASPPGLLVTLGSDAELLDEALLERDLERVERFYRARGYYEAKVVGARIIRADGQRVHVQVVISEGRPVRIAAQAAGQIAVQLEGLESVDDPSTIADLIAESPRPGAIFDESDYERAKQGMRRILAERGYAFASVSGRVDIDLARREARARFDISAGPRARLGPISITGLERVPEDKVQGSLLIARGDEYSAAAIEDARRALVNLGVFSSVNVEIDTSNPGSASVPVKFSLLETAPRTLRLGGGGRLDAVELSANLIAGWEHRNFFGGLRHLLVEARPGLVLFPTRMADFPDLATPDRTLLKGALDVRLVQPSFIEGRTKGFASTTLDVRPLLYADTPLSAPLVGFLEVAARAGLERPFLSHQLFLTLSLNGLAELPLDYGQLSLGGQSPRAAPGAIDDLFIGYPELLARLDLRDDPLDTKNGWLLSHSLQAGLPVLGSSVSDLRLRPEARFYITKTPLTLALRAATGLLFPGNYFPAGRTRRGPGGTVTTADQQVLLFRGFFSGGPFSNRGYALQGVGPRQPFLTSNDRDVPCSTAVAASLTDPRCQRPIGGLTAWELSLELRFPIRWLAPLGAVLFVDASDVRLGRAEYSFEAPHLAPGLGLRYPTPIGPIRLDLGLRLLEALGKEQPDGPAPSAFGAPVTIHLAVGQAF